MQRKIAGQRKRPGALFSDEGAKASRTRMQQTTNRSVSKIGVGDRYSSRMIRSAVWPIQERETYIKPFKPTPLSHMTFKGSISNKASASAPLTVPVREY